jgi:hypothetical protein
MTISTGQSRVVNKHRPNNSDGLGRAMDWTNPPVGRLLKANTAFAVGQSQKSKTGRVDKEVDTIAPTYG